MTAIAMFEKLAGKTVVVEESGHTVRIPTAKQKKGWVSEAVESTHPKGELEAGFTVVAVMGAFEDGEMVQCDGFFAVNGKTDKAYVCDEGTITRLDEPASKLTLTPSEEGDDEEGDDEDGDDDEDADDDEDEGAASDDDE